MENFNYEQEDQFYDTREELSSVSSNWDSDSNEDSSKFLSGRLSYEAWARNLGSFQGRRHKFLQWMTVDLEDESDDVLSSKIDIGIDRITENSGAVLSTSISEDQSCSIQSRTSNEVPQSLRNSDLEDNFVSEVRKSDDEVKVMGDELSRNDMFKRLHEVDSDKKFSSVEIQKNNRNPSLVQPFVHAKVENGRHFVDSEKKVKGGWLRKLGIGMCIVDRNENDAFNPIDFKTIPGKVAQRVRVHPSRKRTKELSSLFIGQELQAHEGSILKMKFSLDGRYLASAGEDSIVRIWEVIEDEILDKFDSARDPSCVYFTMNPLSKLDLHGLDREKDGKGNRLKSSDSACVIFPPKSFHISETPLHEFRGHIGEVLDLSWSNNGFLLSSSTDKTVRLWQVEYNRCLRVFYHNNYVTSVDFNPLDDNYFISGSIDGKVRVWEVLRCKVVDYIDIREIVTAVSYRLDGKGSVVGSMTGNCRFYDILDNHLKLDYQICLQGKKKSPGNRITGFQFSPTDPSKLMITSADSLVRILSGVNVICKFRGHRNAVSQMYASFTADGKHILSADEDSNVYIWNNSNQDKTSSRPKNIWSYESFPSQNASIAIPWCGMKIAMDSIQSPTSSGRMNFHNFDERLGNELSVSSPDCFSLGRAFVSEFLNRGSATWPEEMLLNSSPMTVTPTLCKSEYRFLRNSCQGMSGSPHMWGLVVVTAGWDGRIRTYHNYGLPIRI